MSKAGKRFAFFLLITIILGYVGCEVYNDISTSSDITTDFSKYRSFSWLPDQTESNDLVYNNQIIRNNIRNYFDQSFTQRGYELSADTPDVNLKLIVATKKLEKIIVYPPYQWPYSYGNYFSYSSGFYYYPYESNYYFPHYPIYYYPPSYYSQKYNFIERSITLNVIDRKQNKLVWSGTLRSEIYEADYDNENLRTLVEAIMKKYPIKPGVKPKKANAPVIEDVFTYNKN